MLFPGKKKLNAKNYETVYYNFVELFDFDNNLHPKRFISSRKIIANYEYTGIPVISVN